MWEAADSPDIWDRARVLRLFGLIVLVVEDDEDDEDDDDDP